MTSPLKHALALLSLLALVAWPAGGRAAQATASEMYAQAVRIEQEVELLKRHFKLTGKAAPQKVGDANLRPRHVRAQTYVLLYKLGKLRRKHGLAYIQPGGSEPSLDTGSGLPWGTLQRVLTEIQIFKRYLDIPGQAPVSAPVAGKRTVDLYDTLHRISGELDRLTGPITPSEVYAEAKRFDEDVNAVQRQLRIIEHAAPPPRRDDLRPQDSLRAVFGCLAEVQRLQRSRSLDTVDLSGFDTGKQTEPDDVFTMMQLVLAEWQRYKASLGMVHHITPPAGYEEGKTPTDVVQLLGYVSAKLRDIKPR